MDHRWIYPKTYFNKPTFMVLYIIKNVGDMDMKTGFNTRELTFLALMLAITIIMDLTPLGAVPLGAISATINHIPTIIAGVALGPVAGFIMGTLFGFVTLIHALTRPNTFLDTLFINPLISVLPRMMIGVASYYVYKLFSKTSLKPLSSFAAGIAGSITNTGLVFLMLYLVYAKEVVESVGMAFSAIIITVFTTNAIAEAVIAALLTTVVVAVYNKYYRI